VEFASRVYDAGSRVWLSDDAYRGTVARSASLNRYAYVEGAPTSFVDVLGFYRAAAAIRAQQIAAAEAAYVSAVLSAGAAAPACSGYGCFAAWQAAGPALPASHVQTAAAPWNRGYGYSLACEQVKVYERQLAEYKKQELSFAKMGTTRAREIQLLEIELEFAAVDERIAAERGNLWLYDTVNAVGTVLSDPKEAIHMALDVLGQIPVVGVAFDVVNAGMYAVEGKWTDAGLSMMGAVPLIGNGATALRLGKTGAKVVNAATDMGRVADDVVDIGGDIAKTASKVPSPAAVTPPKVPDVPKVTTPDPPDVTPVKTPTKTPDAPAGAVKADGDLVPGPNNAMRDPATGKFAPNPDSARQQKLAQSKPASGTGQEMVVHPFADGGTHFTSTKSLEDYAPSPTHGPAGGDLYVMPKNQADDLIASGASRADIERAAGLSDGTLGLNKGDVVRIDISDPLDPSRGLRVPDPATGNELHIPYSSRTSGGFTEAVINSPSKLDPNVSVTVLEGLP